MPTAKTLPDHIEIFRAGRHIDDAGGVHEFSEADVAAMAAGYDPTLREAPLCVGHPQSDRPAYGWVAALTGDAGVLRMNSRQVEPRFAEMVADGRYKKRSAAFYSPEHPSNPRPGQWYLRHVAWLGAQPPAIAGLKDPQFAESDSPEGAICFSEAVTPHHQEKTMDEETKKRLEEADAAIAAAKQAKDAAEAEAKRAKEQLTQFAEQQRNERHVQHVAFCEAAVQGAKLRKNQAAAAVAVLDQLGDAVAVEFSEGDATKKISPLEFVKGLITDRAPIVQFGEFAAGNAGGESTKDMTDAEIDKRAKAFAAKHNVSYSEALTKVVSFSA